jgi:hypothetical protein
VLQLVQELEPLITSSDPYERAKGAHLLCRCIQNCELELLSNQTATVLLEFFKSRLDDQMSVDRHLNGILALLQKNIVSKSDSQDIPSR